MRKIPNPSFKEERKIWKKGYAYVIGVDEVGRGAFAGPVVTGAVVFKKNINGSLIKHLGIHDSKLLSPQKRENLDKEIKLHAKYFSVSEVGVPVINKIGIGKATQMAFRRAITSIVKKCHAEFDTSKKLVRLLDSSASKKRILKPPKGISTTRALSSSKGRLSMAAQVQDDSKQNFFVLADGFHIKHIRGIGLKNQKAIVKGDQKIISISAASIIAKVYRDDLMRSLHKKYPHYHFDINKGYGTKVHQMAIKKHGLSKLHRKSFNLSKYNFFWLSVPLMSKFWIFACFGAIRNFSKIF